MYIGEHAARHPDKPAIIMAESGETRSFGALEANSNRAAQLYRACGLRFRDHMAFLLENSLVFYDVCFGADRAGLYYTAIPTKLTAPEIAYIVNDCGARLLVIGSAFAHMADELRAACVQVEHFFITGASAAGWRNWEEATAAQPATPIADEVQGRDMLYSSGTTGKPKGVKRPLNGDAVGAPTLFFNNCRNYYSYDADMVYLSPAPGYHAAPLRYTMVVLRFGGLLVVMRHFDPVHALQLIEKHRVTHSNWVPTMFVRMLKLPADQRAGLDLSSHRVAIHGAGPVSAETKRQMIDWWGPILFEYYAASEGNGTTNITSEEWLQRPGSVGRATIGQPRVVDEESGEELPPGQSGLVYFSDAQPFVYHNDPEKTQAAYNAQGWSTLGDIGYLDEDGFLYLTDRKAFMIISGGVNIYPQEAENVLIQHPAVFDVAVIGVPNEDFGEEVKAVVQLVDPAQAGPEMAQALIDFCRSRLSPIKCPRSVDFDPALPRHETGKLYKRLVKDRYWGNKTSRIV
ncbi:acyl-CoA synthetase [Ferrovibrio sp.]|uniref:acyl-CoA synthetase n=1 Tax=Ferrovibrio sp. TaxID=1917215 RepID=UPI0035B322B4